MDKPKVGTPYPEDRNGIVTKVREIVGHADYMTYWILYKYAPDLLPKKFSSFEELKGFYKSFKAERDEASYDKLAYNPKVQAAIKYLQGVLAGKRINELYETYYKKALDGDVKALEAWLKLNDRFFASEEESELIAIARNAEVELPENTLSMKFDG